MHEWFERAAEQGDLIGAFNYAVCLAEGVGVPRNDERAAFWLKQAAEGVVNAQYWYGRMLAEGRGVAKDDAAAAAWFTRAAEAGHPVAALMLARCWCAAWADPRISRPPAAGTARGLARSGRGGRRTRKTQPGVVDAEAGRGFGGDPNRV